MPRKKTPTVPRITSREQLLDAAAELKQCRLALTDLNADRETEKLAIDRQYDEALTATAQRAEQLEAMGEQWARENTDAFGDKKSIDLVHAVIGWRRGQPTVTKRRGKEKLADLARRMLTITWARKYVRLGEPSVNKDKLLEDRKDLTAAQLLELGLAITQEDRFYFEPTIDEPTPAA